MYLRKHTYIYIYIYIELILVLITPMVITVGILFDHNGGGQTFFSITLCIFILSNTVLLSCIFTPTESRIHTTSEYIHRHGSGISLRIRMLRHIASHE